jgi:hypothetical protein
VRDPSEQGPRTFLQGVVCAGYWNHATAGDHRGDGRKLLLTIQAYFETSKKVSGQSPVDRNSAVIERFDTHVIQGIWCDWSSYRKYIEESISEILSTAAGRGSEGETSDREIQRCNGAGDQGRDRSSPANRIYNLQILLDAQRAKSARMINCSCKSLAKFRMVDTPK